MGADGRAGAQRCEFPYDLNFAPNDAPVILAFAKAGAAKTGRISFSGPEDEGWRDYIRERN